MGVKFDAVKAGDILWYGVRSRERRRTEWSPLTILEVNSATRRVRISKNGREEWRSERDLARYRRAPPEAR